jgi:hypothetical protein
MVKFEFINRLIKRKSKVIPKPPEVYAVGTGTYVGEMLVYCKKDIDNYYFLSIPKNINRIIPIEKFDYAIEHKIAEFAHKLPKPVYKICAKQYQYNEVNSNSKEKQTK